MRLIALLFLLFPLLSFAQLFTNEEGEVYTDEPFFNAEFIRKNDLKQIKGRYSIKKSGEVMKELEAYEVFTFDSLGRLIERYETYPFDGSRDTMFWKYVYNDRGRLIYRSYGSNRRWQYWTYLYDEKGRVVSYDVFRQVKEFGEVRAYKQKTQTYTYEKREADSLKIINNSFDLPFQEERLVYDDAGRLIVRDKRFITNNHGWIDSLHFDKYGRLLQITHQSTREEMPKDKHVYVYDENGNPLSKDVYRYRRHAEEYQFIYNSKTGYCSAVLSRDPATENIVVLRFQQYVSNDEFRMTNDE